MPATYHPAVIQRMQELWEVEDMRGQALINWLEMEYQTGWAWTESLPGGVKIRLPKDRSTLNRMADRLKWASKEDSSVEPISGITDPIWHLSNILARKKAHDYTHSIEIDGLQNPYRTLDAEQIVFQICMDVASEYEPQTKMFNRLRPLIREWVSQEKKEFQDREKEALEAQARIPAIGQAGLLAQLQAQGLPIDEDHAALGMVHTNQDGDEGGDEG